MKVYVVYIWYQDEDIDGMKVFKSLNKAIDMANFYAEEAIYNGMEFDPTEKDRFSYDDIYSLNTIRKVYTNGDDVEQIVIEEMEVI